MKYKYGIVDGKAADCGLFGDKNWCHPFGLLGKCLVWGFEVSNWYCFFFGFAEKITKVVTTALDRFTVWFFYVLITSMVWAKSIKLFIL